MMEKLSHVKYKRDVKKQKFFTRKQWMDRFSKPAKRKRRVNHPWAKLIMQNTVVEDPLHIETTNSEGEEIHVNETRFDTDSAKIGIDNRASACISHRLEDFVGQLTKVNRSIKGFGGERVLNVWKGTIVWKWCDNNGHLHRFRIPNSYYVPGGGCRLLSPQHWAKSYIGTDVTEKIKRGTGETTTSEKCTLFWNDRKYQLDVTLGPNDNVATFFLAPGYDKFDVFCKECKVDYNKTQEEPMAMPASVVSDNEDDDDDDDDVAPPDPPINKPSFWTTLTTPFRRKPTPTPTSTPTARTADFNLNGPMTRSRSMSNSSYGTTPTVIEEEEKQRTPTSKEEEFLRYHHRFGHISNAKLQNMARQNIIPRYLANIHPPACTACLFAKSTRKQWRHKRRKNWTDGKKASRPGEVVSVDQLVSPSPGIIAQITGILTKKRYKYATVYVDQFSGLGYVYLQKTATADETILGKKAFEAFCNQHGVKVTAYHADNGIFRANKWVDECRRHQQTLTFAGVNAHHSNGLAERRIRSLQDLTRAMLIHQHRRWNMGGTIYLWPYALRMANDAINEAPNLKDKMGRSPLQIFSNTEVETNQKHWIPFGCPAYVLNSALQTGRGIHHKWEYRSKVGIYLGRSPNHGRNVALIMDRTTGLVSPQFHVKFDPGFSTVKQDRFDTQWQQRAGLIDPERPGTKRSRASKPSESGYTSNTLMPSSEGVQRPKKKVRSGHVVSTPEQHIDKHDVENVERSTPEDTDEELQLRSNDSQLDGQESQQQQLLLQNDSQQNPESNIKTGRSRQQNERSLKDQRHPSPSQLSHLAEIIIKAMTAELSNATASDVIGELFCFEAMFPNYAGEPEQNPLQVYKATTDPDTMYMHEAMRQKDAAEFRKAMQKEWKDQIENGNFTVIHRSKVPEGATILPAVWQMKRKRDIRTRKVKKYKARLNIDGSRMQYGKHYDQTYAPVASWNSIRTLLILSALFSWHTRQIDYVLAFPQAPVEREIYMKIPAGFKIVNGDTKDYVHQLHRNVYGQKQAGRVFYQYLRNKLVNDVGFRQSKVDECVFYRGNVMYVLYTDDSLLAGPNLEEIEQAIKDIKKAKLDITIEGDIQDFLGVNIERKEDGTIHLTQPHLIDQILKESRLEDNASIKETPAPSSKLLSRH